MTSTLSSQHHDGQFPSAKKILIADDSMALRKMLVQILNSIGYDITEAIHGKAAFQKAQELTYDLIVTDHNMPEMDGVELIRNVRLLPQYQKTPILVLTVESSDDLKKRAKDAGASGWIVKPIHPEIIANVIGELLGEG